MLTLLTFRLTLEFTVFRSMLLRLTLLLLMLALLIFPRLMLAPPEPADLFPTAGLAPPPPRAMRASATPDHTPLIRRTAKITIILRMVPSCFTNISFFQFTPL